MALIAISGKIGSGKDTVGNIINYLIWLKFMGYTQEEKPYKESKFDYYIGKQSYKVKKFAGKLKQIVSLLIGFSIEDLEKQVIKDRLLSDSWQQYEIYHFGRKISKVFNTEGEAKKFCIDATNSQHDYTYQKSTRTVRWMLQYVGTDLLRDRLHENAHINALFADYNAESLKDNPQLNVADYSNSIFPNWIITDLRFPNELEAVKKRNGITVRVERPIICNVCKTTKHERRGKMCYEASCPNQFKEHPSETALDNAEFDYIIDNSGTIEDLILKVKDILIKEKII